MWERGTGNMLEIFGQQKIPKAALPLQLRASLTKIRQIIRGRYEGRGYELESNVRKKQSGGWGPLP